MVSSGPSPGEGDDNRDVAKPFWKDGDRTGELRLDLERAGHRKVLRGGGRGRLKKVVWRRGAMTVEFANEGPIFTVLQGISISYSSRLKCPSYWSAARHSKMVPKAVCQSDHDTDSYTMKYENDKGKPKWRLGKRWQLVRYAVFDRTEVEEGRMNRFDRRVCANRDIVEWGRQWPV